MKVSPKEKLNDKARKMIDLIYDEVFEGGQKSFTSSFIDKKTNLKCELTVQIIVSDPDDDCSPLLDPSIIENLDDDVDDDF